MYYNDHPPPHFHATYAEHHALIAIDTLEVLRGQLPRRVLALAVEWAILHRDELRTAWEQASGGRPPQRIAPLD